MADFTSYFWTIYISGITLAGIFACGWLLWANMTRKAAGPVQTMGHVWDEDLAELNNPLPLWWAWLFVITIVFGLFYLAFYPGLGTNKGLLGWSATGQYRNEQSEAAARYDPLYKKYAAVAIPELAGDAKAHAIGERLFLNNCAQCHGSDAKGAKGFPNLTDKDWLWGGEPARIEETIMGGRQNQMPTMAAALGGAQGVNEMANYVLSLSGSPHDVAKAASAKPKFMICGACHGANGQGNPLMGTPNLTDSTWLYGGSSDTIKETISNGRSNQMPNFGERLGPEKVHLLAAYVWGLSNKPDAVAPAK